MTDKNTRLLQILGGDIHALNFCRDIAFVSEIFDDIYDGDEPQKSQIEDALTCVLNLPANPFYRANFDYLHPVIDLAVTHWIASNQVNKDNIERAHFFRYLGVQIWVSAATIKHGAKEAAKLIYEIWDFSTMETLEEFKHEIIKPI